MQVLQEINRDGMALEASDPPSPEQRMRMRLGVYFYAEPVPQPPTPEGPSRRPEAQQKRQERPMTTTPAMNSLVRWLLHAALGIATVALAACGGGGQLASGGIVGTGITIGSVGSVTAIGSVTVNGVRFTTAGAP